MISVTFLNSPCKTKCQTKSSHYLVVVPNGQIINCCSAILRSLHHGQWSVFLPFEFHVYTFLGWSGEGETTNFLSPPCLCNSFLYWKGRTHLLGKIFLRYPFILVQNFINTFKVHLEIPKVYIVGDQEHVLPHNESKVWDKTMLIKMEPYLGLEWKRSTHLTES